MKEIWKWGLTARALVRSSLISETRPAAVLFLTCSAPSMSKTKPSAPLLATRASCAATHSERALALSTRRA